MDDEENTLKAGDVCLDCQQRGIEKYLRYFKINLNGDTLLKCESNVCMYPYDMSSTDDDDDNDEDDSDANTENTEIKSISETNSIKFIDDLLQQIKNEDAEQNCNYNEPLTTVNSNNENINNTEHFKDQSNELHSEFEISFLDTIGDIVNENSTYTTTNIATETAEYLVNNYKVDFSVNEPPPSLTTFDNFAGEPFVKEPIDNKTSVDNKHRPIISLPSLLDDYEIQQFDKPKINIQTIETIKLNESNATNLPISMEISKVSAATELKTKPTVKSNELLLTNATTSTMKLEVADNRDPPKTSIELLVKNSTFSVPTKSLDIPKANIMKGSDFLKKLAIIDEKTPKYNIKCKDVRKKTLIKKEKIKKESLRKAAVDDDNNSTHSSINEKTMDNAKQTESKPIKEEINFSLEAITELIKAKKIKNCTKSN